MHTHEHSMYNVREDVKQSDSATIHAHMHTLIHSLCLPVILFTFLRNITMLCWIRIRLRLRSYTVMNLYACIYVCYFKPTAYLFLRFIYKNEQMAMKFQWNMLMEINDWNGSIVDNLLIVSNIWVKPIFFSFLGTAICTHWAKPFARYMCQNHHTAGQTNYAKCGWHSIIAGCWPSKCIANKFELFSPKIIDRLLHTIPFDAVARFKQSIYTQSR